MRFWEDRYELSEAAGFGQIAFRVGVVLLLLTLVGAFFNSKQFFHSYLHAFVFWTSLALGGLFFTMLHHLTGAKWSVVLRRIAESVMACLPLMALFFIPLIFGMHDLFHWTHADAVANDPVLQKKTPYLNTGFFVVRAILFFAIWFTLSKALYHHSLAQDRGVASATGERFFRKAQRLSAPGMILFALTITFAAFDWLMSLDPHWFSTIFGVYFFAGSVTAVLSFFTLVCIGLRKKGVMHKVITEEHYHDLGKLMFGFTVFWAYIAFSQYFLIWYANIPEETIWFLHRWEGSWKVVSMLVLFGHFVVPFTVLLSRAAKRNLKVLGGVAAWYLFIHWIDLYWLIFPTLHHHGAHFSWMDVTAVVGMGGVFLATFWGKFSSHALVPIKDPGLKASIHFENA